jgi:uncharacterized protein YycO
MKKIVSLFMIIITVLAIPAVASAANNNSNNNYHEYIKLINNNILDEDVTFEDWQEFKDSEVCLEQNLANSENIIDVCDSCQINDSYVMKAGDIFITNGTSSFGLSGHAGIAVSPDYILHILGTGSYPSLTTLSGWQKSFNPYGWTKVYRHSDPSVAQDAALWAENTYKNTQTKYLINMDLASTSTTYCSKLVWQAYFYGPQAPATSGPTVGIRSPYILPTAIYNLNLVVSYEKLQS